MDYIIVPTESKSEKDFFLNLMKKMQKKASVLSSKELEDYAFGKALREAGCSGKGSLSRVKSHLAQIASGK